MGLRLDTYLVNAGLAASRAQARDAIKRGTVSVDGVVVTKAGTMVVDGRQVTLSKDALAYVSRGGLKLAAALDRFGYDPAGRVVLDVGASTGGFTDVCLQRGALRIFAIDVGVGQLHQRLRDDPRVISLEQTDVRRLCPGAAAGIAQVDAVVMDVSFMSAILAMPAALALAGPGSWLVVLVKPQFEAGPKHVGKGGIVKSEATREAAVEKVRAWIAERTGWTVDGVMTSPIAGGEGNVEFLIGARRDE